MPELFKFIAVSALLLISQSTHACICIPKSDALLFHENRNIQEATVIKVERDTGSTWFITLGEIKRWKGNDSFTQVIASLQNSSCSININEGERWVFFFNKLDKKGRYDLDDCSPARNLRGDQFDINQLLSRSIFDEYSLPDSVYSLHRLRITAMMDQHFRDLKLDSLVDTAAGIRFTINAQGLIQSVSLLDAFLLSDLDAKTAQGGTISLDYFPVINHPKLEAFIQELKGITYPVLHHYGHDLKVAIDYVYPYRR